MKLLVAYYDLGHGSHGRARCYEHAVDPITGKTLCGHKEQGTLVWKEINSKPLYLCHHCQELITKPTDAERLASWNLWAQSPEQ